MYIVVHMNLCDISFLIHRVSYDVRSHFAASVNSSVKAFHEVEERSHAAKCRQTCAVLLATTKSRLVH